MSLIVHKEQSGIGLVETIVALGVAIVVITSLVSLSVFTLRTSTESKRLIAGSKMANNELELVRAVRDSQTTWDDFINEVSNCTQGSPCYINSSTFSVQSGTKTADDVVVSFYTNDPINLDTVEITDTVVRINVIATWSIGTNTKNANIYTDLSRWRFQ